MGVLEQPAAVRSALRFDDVDRLGHSLVCGDAGVPQMRIVAARATNMRSVTLSIRTAIAVALCLIALGPVSGSAGASPTAQPAGCDALGDADRTVANDIPNLDPAGSLGSPELCLLAYPAAGVSKAVILFLDDATQFDAAKAGALDQLAVIGIDPCTVATWEGQGLGSLKLTDDERMNSPAVCAPRLVAADSNARTLLPAVQIALNQVMDATRTQTTFQPTRPLTIRIYTDLNLAIPEFNTYILPIVPGETPDTLAQRTRTGAYWFKTVDPVLGSLILLNLTAPTSQSVGDITYQVGFTYAAYADASLNGNSQVDRWFKQGMDSFQGQRNGGSAPGLLNIAASAQREGRETTSLVDLAADESWYAHQRVEGNQVVQARAHAAIEYLAELYGVDTIIGLFRQNHDASQSDFEASLATLTGQDLATFNDAFSKWLGSVTAHTARGGNGGNDFHVDVFASPAANQVEVTVTYDRNVPCGNSRQVQQGAKVTFWTQAQAGGLLTATAYLTGATVTFQGTVAGGTPTGTVRFANPTTGCDTGALKFG
ncbi:MAG TPA: hypothetical protein VKQ30_20270 [Ktedonobacterales bacterium]|nr:hypothetical protein [Ktedonobacterales bacterium]